MSKVYIKIDNRNRIIACDGGYTIHNCQPIHEWILIDEGEGDRYNLCQSHYFVPSLFNEHGIPNWEYHNGQCHRRSVNEIAADYIPEPAIPDPIQALQQEVKLVKAQINSLEERGEFVEDVIAEMATVVYE